jgi:hypothetical protein
MSRFQKKGRVSIWVGRHRCDPTVDLLKDLCGVSSYDLDSQECLVDDETWANQPIKQLLQKLSYCDSFLAKALDTAQALNISEALYVVAQFDFAYDPKKVEKPIAPDPLFLGSFRWSEE